MIPIPKNNNNENYLYTHLMVPFVIHVGRDGVSGGEEKFSFQLVGMHVLLQVGAAEFTIPIVRNMS